jgi:TonB family protein
MTMVVFRPSAAARVPGRSVEVGGGGVRAVFPSELQNGERVEIEFALPPSRNTLRFPLIVRHRQGSEFGFEFLSLKRGQRRALDALEQHAALGLVHIINAPERACDVTPPPARVGTIVCPSCGSEFKADKVICINCGAPTHQDPIPEPPPREEKPIKLLRHASWVPTWAPSSHKTSGPPMGSDSLIAILFVLTLGLGLWQWLNTAPPPKESDHGVNISFSDALIALDPLPQAERPSQPSAPVSSSDRGRRSEPGPSAGFAVVGGPAGGPAGGSDERRANSRNGSRSASAPGPSTPSQSSPPRAGGAPAASSQSSMQSSAPPSALSGLNQADQSLANAASAAFPAGIGPSSSLREEHWKGAGLQLLERIVPRYPTLAASERVQGQVVLVATIAKDGRVADVRPVSGPAVLASSAVDAVRQWRFRPYQVDGKPVQVQTNIRVNFNLDK